MLESCILHLLPPCEQDHSTTAPSRVANTTFVRAAVVTALLLLTAVSFSDTSTSSSLDHIEACDARDKQGDSSGRDATRAVSQEHFNFLTHRGDKTAMSVNVVLLGCGLVGKAVLKMLVRLPSNRHAPYDPFMHVHLLPCPRGRLACRTCMLAETSPSCKSCAKKGCCAAGCASAMPHRLSQLVHTRTLKIAAHTTLARHVLT